MDLVVLRVCITLRAGKNHALVVRPVVHTQLLPGSRGAPQPQTHPTASRLWAFEMCRCACDGIRNKYLNLPS